ncbi:MAG: DNA-binding NarL/FixJ family response regulator [Candidatus Pelagisphaera sp.]
MDKRNHTPKHVLLIDDHPVCRHGLERIFNNSNEFSFDEFSTSVDDAVQPKQEPDIVALDIAIAKCKGIASIKDLKRRFPKSAILVITSHDELLFAERCLKAGANGYLMKTASKEALIKAFHEMAEGHLHVSDRIRSRILNRVSGYSSELDETPHVDRLSDRELLIVQHISQSKNNQEIAQELQISQKTIESHRSRIKSKLELDSPNELIRFAMRLRTALA